MTIETAELRTLNSFEIITHKASYLVVFEFKKKIKLDSEDLIAPEIDLEINEIVYEEKQI